MRVVDVTQWYADRSGGIRTYLHAKAAWAARAGHQHAVVVPGPTDVRRTLVESRVVSLKGWTPTQRWGYRVMLRRGPVLRALDELQPDVVVVHDALAFPSAVVAWARAAGVGVALYCHSFAKDALDGIPETVALPVRRLLDAKQRRAFTMPDLLLAGSAGVGEVLERISDRPVVVAPLGIDLGMLTVARADTGLRALLSPGAPMLLYAGRISPEKRVDLLPAMMRELKVPATLVIAGSGIAETSLRREARALGVADRIRFIGHVADRSRLASLMATADCFVHPNPAEPFGLAPLEALAAGCRVVAPNSGGCRENLTGTPAVLVRPADAGALARGVRMALRAPRPTVDLSSRTWDRTFEREWECYASLRAAAAPRSAA